jgi:transcriptional regulator with PAS, ATPase and Fis domain
MNEVNSKNNGDETIAKNPAWVARAEPKTAVNYRTSSPDLSLKSYRNEAEIHAITSALAHTGWNRKRAAQLLSISYRGLLYKIRRHNITSPIQQG